MLSMFSLLTPKQPLRIEFWGDEIERLSEFDLLTGETIQVLDSYRIYPANQYVTTKDKIERACKSIEKELNERVAWFENKAFCLRHSEYECEQNMIWRCLGKLASAMELKTIRDTSQPESLVRDRGVSSIFSR